MLLFTLKTAFRNLLSKKQNAFIIIFSLAIAFAFSNILITFVSYELNTDSFHEKKDRIYRLFSDDPMDHDKKIRYIQGKVDQFLVDNFPEVDKICQVTTLNNEGSSLRTKHIDLTDQLVLRVDSTFFNFFDFPLSEGNIFKAISEDGIVLKEALAKKLFKNPPFTGRMLDLINGKDIRPMKVTAILKDFHENTQFNFDAIILGHESWGGSVFLMLNENSKSESLVKKLNKSKNMPSLLGPGKAQYELEPFTSSYFNASGVQPFDRYRNKQLIVICWVVMLLLSFTASFNFINLYVVGLLTRRKEIGIKRVFGATKGSMILAIGVEVALYVFFSIILSVAFTYYFLPVFNSSFNTQLSFSYFTYAKVIAIVIGVIALLGLFITLYLSIFIWRLNTIGLLTDKLTYKVNANRFLFTVQFFVSVGLVICSMVVIMQMQYIQNKPLGFNKQLLQLHVPSDDQKVKLNVLKERLLNYPQISRVATSSGNPISGSWIIRYRINDQTFYSPYLISGDEDLTETMGLTIIDGKNYNSQDSHGKLVNETFVRFFDMKNPIGQPIPGSEDYIVGIVKDFNCVSLKQEIPPFIISYKENRSYLLIDISDVDPGQIIPLIAGEWQQVFPDVIFDYKLIEDELLAKHKEDTYFFRMIISFTVASLIISCFGLYGIASFTFSRRTKEIGIRKVLGASFTNILLLVWKDYVKLITIGYLLAIPVVNYFLKEWLNQFAYKIELNWWLYVTPGLIIMMIALLTISGQSVKVANINPVDSLRDE